MDVSATLEPDCDGDGFGDETQDACPGDALRPARARDDDHQAAEGQDQEEAGRVRVQLVASPGSTFECALDGTPFAACTSPLIRKVGKGKHVFQVRAIDAVGNVDGTPAIAEWKVKKKKR